ncbi:MAG: VacB/RNase II family 3'-5' exoribonuclease [SAR86 cluster bacterium]|uniref:exoribonuclease II n=1 Tax=SAR86 cluster bacterium TaxID=2030880 RepID=A0A838Y1E2_9GAMM|nr:VacB/RNase II family 3'-5' exoribonuclease [SAR86 cluster bacterium]
MYKEAILDAVSMHELPSKWHSDVLKEAKNATKKKKASKYRQDLRKLPFITIDGEDAKDFDDAIYCIKNSGGFKLFVAIADVSFYVETGSKTDKEAQKRGTSIYFPAKVIPMLPEDLSNGICSLKPNEERCAMICEMSLSLDGKRGKNKFYSGLIKSKARLTYNQVEEHLQGSAKIELPQAHDSIKDLNELTNLRLIHRNKRKALEINPKEINLKLNRNKEVKNIQVKKSLFAHKLVEESMLLANESAAEFMQDRLNLGVYRIHEDPDPIKLELLKKHFHVPAQISKKLSPLEVINSCLKQANKKNDDVGKILVLQTLARAEYSTNNLGHFGLQLQRYAHFTSPIRRYPDLLVHRLINSLLAHKKPNRTKNELQDECENASMLERRAEKASRQVEQVLVCEYLKRKIGSTMNGVITGVTDFGLFINLESYFISGLLHVSDLPDDHYHLLNNQSVLKGRKRGGVFKLGQKIKVKIAAIFPLERKINLVIPNGK